MKISLQYNGGTITSTGGGGGVLMDSKHQVDLVVVEVMINQVNSNSKSRLCWWWGLL